MKPRRLAFSVLAASMVLALVVVEPLAFGAPGPEDPNADLLTRIDLLEAAVKKLERSRDLTLLKTRLDELELSTRIRRPAGSPPLSSPPGHELAQLRSENATLKRTVSTLEAKINRVESIAAPLRREIDQLELKVSTLQNTVDRLQSRR